VIGADARVTSDCGSLVPLCEFSPSDPKRARLMDEHRTAYDQLYLYTMGRPRFLLQHVVDAHAAQSASAETKPMKLFFALAGLFLHVERGFSGHEVQRVHMLLAKGQRHYPAIALPAERGLVTAADVLIAAEGPARDAAITEWCRSVWEAFGASRGTIVEFLKARDIG
jgi:hypothetical protein